MIRFLKNIDHWIARLETVLLVTVLSIMVILAFLQVVLRNLFSEGILWGDTFLRHLVLWVGFLGASLATREKKHINIDLFTRFFKAKLNSLFVAITNLFAAIVCWYLTSAAYTFVMDEKSYGTTLFNDIPSWYFQVIIPVGFLLMTFRVLVIFMENLIDIFSSKSGEAK